MQSGQCLSDERVAVGDLGKAFTELQQLKKSKA
jgi:hypothetical protein